MFRAKLYSLILYLLVSPFLSLLLSLYHFRSCSLVHLSAMYFYNVLLQRTCSIARRRACRGSIICPKTSSSEIVLQRGNNVQKWKIELERAACVFLRGICLYTGRAYSPRASLDWNTIHETSLFLKDDLRKSSESLARLVIFFHRARLLSVRFHPAFVSFCFATDAIFRHTQSLSNAQHCNVLSGDELELAYFLRFRFLILFSSPLFL